MNIISKLRLFDYIIILFCVLTGVYILLGYNQLSNVYIHISIRIVLILVILVFSRFSDINNNTFQFIRNFYPLLLMGYFYSETDYYNNLIFNNFDIALVNFENFLFDVQLSLEFSRIVPYKWFSELMHFGYFSFYIVSFGVPFLYYVKARIDFEKIIFIIILSFCFYFILFIIFPSVGPQFYFPSSQIEVPDGFLFKYFMDFIILNFETQTGAFPSSHVGISIVILVLIRKQFKSLFFFLVPVIFILLLSTVYLKAHYVIDIIAGLITGVIFYWISKKLYNKISNLNNETKCN